MVKSCTTKQNQDFATLALLCVWANADDKACVVLLLMELRHLAHEPTKPLELAFRI